MKNTFNTSWKESKQPRKQRKYLHNMPNHLRQKQMSATLDKSLRTKYGIRSLEVRKGDEVVVMRGKFKKKAGKIVEVNVKENVVAVENVQNTKKDGAKINVWFHPSKLKIKSIVDDKFRLPAKKTEQKEK
jgi:large subunit ribosomal protein L24